MQMAPPREGNHTDIQSALADHRSLIFGKGSSPWTCRGKLIDRAAAERVLNKEKGELPLAAVLRCRVRYFTDGAVLGTRNSCAAIPVPGSRAVAAGSRCRCIGRVGPLG